MTDKPMMAAIVLGICSVLSIAMGLLFFITVAAKMGGGI